MTHELKSFFKSNQGFVYNWVSRLRFLYVYMCDKTCTVVSFGLFLSFSSISNSFKWILQWLIRLTLYTKPSHLKLVSFGRVIIFYIQPTKLSWDFIHVNRTSSPLNKITSNFSKIRIYLKWSLQHFEDEESRLHKVLQYLCSNIYSGFLL